MSLTLINKWLLWLDEAQGVLTQADALQTMRTTGGLTRKQSNAVFNQWLKER